MHVFCFAQDESFQQRLGEAVEQAGHEYLACSSLSALRDALGETEADVLVVHRDVDPDTAFLVAAAARVMVPRLRCIALIPDEDDARAEKLGKVGVQEVLHAQATPLEILQRAEKQEPLEPDLTGYGLVAEKELAALQGLHRSTDGSPEATWLLGFAYYRSTMFAEAVPMLERAVEQDPGNLQARYYLGSCFYRLGDPEKAREHWGAVAEQAPEGRLAKRAREHLERLDG